MYLCPCCLPFCFGGCSPGHVISTAQIWTNVLHRFLQKPWKVAFALSPTGNSHKWWDGHTFQHLGNLVGHFVTRFVRCFWPWIRPDWNLTFEQFEKRSCIHQLIILHILADIRKQNCLSCPECQSIKFIIVVSAYCPFKDSQCMGMVSAYPNPPSHPPRHLDPPTGALPHGHVVPIYKSSLAQIKSWENEKWNQKPPNSEARTEGKFVFPRSQVCGLSDPHPLLPGRQKWSDQRLLIHSPNPSIEQDETRKPN